MKAEGDEEQHGGAGGLIITMVHYEASGGLVVGLIVC